MIDEQRKEELKNAARRFLESRGVEIDDETDSMEIEVEEQSKKFDRTQEVRYNMFELDLQYFGGRGGGSNLGNGSGKSIGIVDQVSVMLHYHDSDNAPYIDDMSQSASDMFNEFSEVRGLISDVTVATLTGADKTNTLGFYDGSTGVVSLNDNFTDIDKMNRVYDASIKSGYHPSRGNKSGTQAVMYHELGHALTDQIAKKLGISGGVTYTALDKAARLIVKAAYKATKGSGGTTAWAKGISGYATDSNAETIAEAVSDYFCNGNKAHTRSIAIVNEMKRLLKNA